MPLNRQPLETSRQPLDVAPPPPMPSGVSDSLATAVLAVKGLPATEWPRIKEAISMSGHSPELDDAEFMFNNKLNAKAGAVLASHVYDLAKSGNYDDTLALLNQGTVQERVTRAAEQMVKDQGVALPASVAESLARGDLEFNQTPVLRQDRASTLEDPVAKVRDNDEAKLTKYAAILEHAKESGGVTESLGENLGGGLVAMTVAPTVLAYSALARKFDLNLGFFKSMSVANVIEAVNKKAYSMPTQEARDAFLRDVVQYTLDSNWFVADSQTAHIINRTMSPDAISSLSDPQRAAFYSDLMFQALDVANLAAIPVAGGVGSLMTRLRQVPASVAEVAATSPARGADLLRSALDGTGVVIEREPIAMGQMPKPSFGTKAEVDAVPNIDPNLGTVPDILAQEELRLNSLREDARAIADTAYLRNLPESDQTAALKRNIAEFEGQFNGTYRPSQSEYRISPDGATATYTASIGASAESGFDWPTAISVGRSYQEKGLTPRIYKVVEGKKVYIELTDVQLMKEADRIAINSPKFRPKNEFYLELERKYTFAPEDMSAFGDDIVRNGWSWFVPITKNLGVPSAWLKRIIYKQYVGNELAEVALDKKLEMILAPVRASSTKDQALLNEVLIWESEFAPAAGRNVKLADLVGKFGNKATPDLIRNYYTMRRYFDFTHEVAQKQVYNFLGGKKAASLVNKTNGNMYHGVPLASEDSLIARARIDLYNPESGLIETMTAKQIREMYARGGSVLKSNLSEKMGSYVTNLIKADSTTQPNWGRTALSPFVLKYEYGYHPKIGINNVIVSELHKNVNVNGTVQDYTEAFMAVGTRKEGERAIAQLAVEHPNKKFIIMDNASFTEQDRVLSRMQALRNQDNQLMYGDRKIGLKGPDGLPAATLDPLNAALIQAGMLSRQVSMESLSEFMMVGFRKQFKGLIDEINLQRGNHPLSVDLDSYQDVRAALQVKIDNGSSMAKSALLTWDYIHQMRGVLSFSSTHVRKAMSKLSDEYYNIAVLMGKASSASAGRDVIAGFSPFQFAKDLAYWKYIKGNPTRQLLVQGVQPGFVLPIAAKAYNGNIVKWFSDGMDLWAGYRRKGIAQTAGVNVPDKLIASSAKSMGFSVAGYNRAIEQLDRMGLFQRINPRGWAEDMIGNDNSLPRTGFGRGVKKAAAPINFVGDWAATGFKTGETINVALAGGALALRRFMRANKITDPLNITREGWDTIAVDATDFAGGMIRSNRADWQQGEFLSTSLQFLSFTHKATLSSLGLNTNSALRPIVAPVLLLNQLVLFGTNGLPGMNYLSDELVQLGADPDMVDVIRGGVTDMFIDTFLQIATQDPTVDVDASKYFGHLTGVGYTAQSLYRAVFDAPQPLWAAALGMTGAGGKVLGDTFTNLALLWNLTSIEADDSWDDSKFLVAAEIFGSTWFSQLDKITQARFAMRFGRFPSTNNKMQAVKVSTIEAFIYGITGGLRPQDQSDFFDTLDKLNTTEWTKPMYSGAEDDAREYNDTVTKILLLAKGGQRSREDVVRDLEMIKMVYETEDPHYARIFERTLKTINKGLEAQNKDIGTLIMEFAKKDVDIPMWVLHNVNKSKTVDPAHKPAISEYVLRRHQDILKAIPMAIDNRQNEINMLTEEQK